MDISKILSEAVSYFKAIGVQEAIAFSNDEDILLHLYRIISTASEIQPFKISEERNRPQRGNLEERNRVLWQGITALTNLQLSRSEIIVIKKQLE
eukprot:CAMPEP_0169309458 /NCGR_PEP_ID=MMETSP1017-20121227/2424_1 /TAXON_ID=342587 /ORGANISM="Karlodinium micrum, Strain CCMP2283" /LENGTH=94 /DNA_ID=CAMNT_0009402989 /DNA_START=208 /DNA_END=492 /DNA_ORIENTATION=+